VSGFRIVETWIDGRLVVGALLAAGGGFAAQWFRAWLDDRRSRKLCRSRLLLDLVDFLESEAILRRVPESEMLPTVAFDSFLQIAANATEMRRDLPLLLDRDFQRKVIGWYSLIRMTSEEALQHHQWYMYHLQHGGNFNDKAQALRNGTMKSLAMHAALAREIQRRLS
jgi:hypothetical protein